jgi:glycosyltransferase involved in cell wall biosynthesis
MSVGEMLISIIIATYNRAKTLQQCIDSITCQTYPHTELIIIDGGSTDDTVEILKANADRITYWESKKDHGIYDAWNKGLDHAHGEWIYFLGADDYCWAPDVLNQILQQILQHIISAGKGVTVVYGKVALVSSSGKVLEILGKSWEKSKRQFFRGRCIPYEGVFHHKSLFDRYGKFDSSFRIAGDYEFLLRVLKNTEAYFASNVIVSAQRIGGVCNAPQSELQTLKECVRAQKRHLGKIALLLKWDIVMAYAKKILRSTVGEHATNYIVDIFRVMNGRPPIWSRL